MAGTRLDIVFEGGGARGLALNGAVAELERRGFEPARLVGTSAGSIAATLIAAGYSGEDLRRVGLEQLPSGASRMTTFLEMPSRFSDDEIMHSTIGDILAIALDPFLPKVIERPIERWTVRAMLEVPAFAQLFSFVERGGLYSADGFLEWLTERLDADGRNLSSLTLAGFYERTGRELTLITSDTSATRMLVLNHRTAPDLPVRYAVRMSMSIPFLWPEVLWRDEWGTYQGSRISGHAMMDGGLVSNFALRLLVSDSPWITQIMGGPPDPERHILGLGLDSSIPVDGTTAATPRIGLHSKVIDRVERVFDTAISGNDTTELDEYADVVCELPTGGYGTLEFDMSQARIERLMDCGAATVGRWLAQRDGLPHRIASVREMLAPASGPRRASRPMSAEVVNAE